MADDAPVVNEDAEATATTESTTDETKELKVVTDGEPVEVGIQPEDESEEQSQDETKEETEGEETDTGEPDGKPLGEKAVNRLHAVTKENKHLKEYISKLQSESVPEVKEYDIAEAKERGLTQEQARIEALEYDRAMEKQQREVERQTAELQDLNTQVRADMEALEKDFPHLVGNEADAQALIQDWEDHAGVQYLVDDQGQYIIGPDGAPLVGQASKSIYEFASLLDRYGASRQIQGETNGQKAAEKKLSAVEVPPSKPSKTDNREDSSLSADDYAKKYGLKLQR